jgi:hypothetical protein
MARYFFDTDDGETFLEDEDGIELDGVESARFQAQRGLVDMARDVVPGGGPRRTMTVRVRDETGRPVLRAALALIVEQEP